MPPLKRSLPLICFALLVCCFSTTLSATTDKPTQAPSAEEIRLFENHLTDLEQDFLDIERLDTERLDTERLDTERRTQSSASSSARATSTTEDERARMVQHLNLFEYQILHLGASASTPLLSRLDALRQRLSAPIVEPTEADTAITSSETDLRTVATPQDSGFEPELTKVAPVNDSCAAALPISFGVVTPNFSQATIDGRSSCEDDFVSADVWYSVTPEVDGPFSIYPTEAVFDELAISVYRSCPGTPINEIACATARGLQIDGRAGEELIIRVANSGARNPAVRVGPVATISGTVLESIGGAPATPSEVRFYDRNGSFFDSVDVDNDGSYSFPAIKPGTYFASAGGDFHESEAFDNFECTDPNDDCFPEDWTPIEVGVGAQVGAIDFDLNRFGRISGTVRDTITGQPVVFARFTIRGNSEPFVRTDENGEYSLSVLPSVPHTMSVSHPEYQPQLYDGIPCPTGICDLSLATPIDVEFFEHRRNVDIHLEALGRISGQVRDAISGQAIPFIEVRVFDLDEDVVATALSDTDGNYAVGGLEPGEYRVKTAVRPLRDHFDELFEEIPCPSSRCDLASGTPVTVALNASISGIDFTLGRTGQISGILRDAQTGEEFAGGVSVFGENGSSVTGIGTEDRGFLLEGLSPGTYFLLGSTPFHLPQIFGGPACPDDGFCDISQGSPIQVMAGSTTHIEVVLDRFGVIEGSVTDAETSEPVREGIVSLWNSDGFLVETERVQDDGTYKLLIGHPGTYTVSISSSGFRRDLYPGIPLPCNGNSCDPSGGTPITVNLNEAVSDIDFALIPLAVPPTGSIAGSLRSRSGEPIRSRIRLWDASGQSLESRSVLGDFLFEDLMPGNYRMTTEADSDGYLNQVFGGPACDGSCDPLSGSLIRVRENVTTRGIDFFLSRRGVISGTVRDARWNEPLREARIIISDADGQVVTSVETDASGHYEVINLRPGTYYATAGLHAYLGQLYDGSPCPTQRCDPTVGIPLQMDSNIALTNIDFELQLQQGIVGTVYDERTGVPVQGASVLAYTADGFVDGVQTSASGHYSLGLELGTYYLAVDPESSDYEGLSEVYNDIPCAPDSTCEPLEGDPITMIDNQVLEGFDFALSGEFCTPSFFTLCLNDRRFSVSLRYGDFEGNSRSAFTRPLTEDSGTFFFFDPDNLEIVVKVLNACVDPFNHFWVFTTGLTNLETEMIVTDTYTQETRTYSNPLGMPFELVTDTSAFDTCSLEAVGGSAATPRPVEEDLSSYAPLLDKLETLLSAPGYSLTQPESKSIDVETTEAKTSVDCTPSSTVLCLQQDRFRVEALWADQTGSSGSGQAVPLTPDTGYFWFFADDNVEAMVKILDACAEDAFNSFWVFAAGLTDVEVTLRVTDTLTGVERDYVNPLGSPFRAVQDTAAFLTCP